MKKLQFSDMLFRDTPKESIDFDLHKKFIIQKVLNYGTIEDMKILFGLYDREILKQEVIHINYLSQQALAFISHYLSLPKEIFKCYILKQSQPNLWKY